MGNLIFIYALVNLISLIPVAHAADKRVVSTGWASLVALIFSPLIGFLFILCHPTKTEKEYQPFLKKVAKQLETHSEESFAKIWQQTAEQKLKQVIYEPKFYEILKNMGETIGYLDQQMQEKTILLTIEQLDDQIFLMKDQVVKNCKMYRSLGISLSVLIVIILL